MGYLQILREIRDPNSEYHRRANEAVKARMRDSWYHKALARAYYESATGEKMSYQFEKLLKEEYGLGWHKDPNFFAPQRYEGESPEQFHARYDFYRTHMKIAERVAREEIKDL